MWLIVGSSNSLIDVIGHVGMFGVRDHITSLILSGPKSRWLGADFGPKPLKRPGPGTRSRQRTGGPVASHESSNCGSTNAALRRRLPERLESPPDHEEWRRVEDRAVRAGHDADQQGEREAFQGVAAGDQDRDQDEDDSEAGDDRPDGRLHDAEVHDLLEREPLADAKVLADSVEDDDGVVD